MLDNYLIMIHGLTHIYYGVIKTKHCLLIDPVFEQVNGDLSLIKIRTQFKICTF